VSRISFKNRSEENKSVVANAGTYLKIKCAKPSTCDLEKEAKSEHIPRKNYSIFS
jgi:hypothetical protein